MSKRQNKRANVVEVSSDATNAPTRNDNGIIPLTGNPETDAEIMRIHLGSFRTPIVYPHNSTLPHQRQEAI